MSETNRKALAIAHAYVNAITNRNVDAIIAISADDVICTSPMGRISGTEAFRGFHSGFARMLKKATVLAAYGDDEQAVIVYDAETQPVPSAVTAEIIKVRNGKIASTDVIFDATPFAGYRATAQAR
jgi:hypothetical protein